MKVSGTDSRAVFLGVGGDVSALRGNCNDAGK